MVRQLDEPVLDLRQHASIIRLYPVTRHVGADNLSQLGVLPTVGWIGVQTVLDVRRCRPRDTEGALEVARPGRG